VIVGRTLGSLWAKTHYVFYQLDQLKPGDEIVVNDKKQKEAPLEVYGTLTVRLEDFWVTYPVSIKTVVSLQSCTPVPTFEHRLIVRGELGS
jgi:sortase A